MEYLHEPFQNAQPMRRNVLNYSNHIDDALHAVLAKQEKDYDIPKGKKVVFFISVWHHVDLFMEAPPLIFCIITVQRNIDAETHWDDFKSSGAVLF